MLSLPNYFCTFVKNQLAIFVCILFLDCLLCSNDPFVYPFANITPSLFPHWHLWVRSICYMLLPWRPLDILVLSACTLLFSHLVTSNSSFRIQLKCHILRKNFPSWWSKRFHDKRKKIKTYQFKRASNYQFSKNQGLLMALKAIWIS